MGWGIAELSTMINTVAVYAYCNDSFPKHQVYKTSFKAILNFLTNSKLNCNFCRERSVP
jgi:hypothetical protein